MREKHSFSSKCKNLFFKLKNKINTFKNREKKPHPHLDRAVVIIIYYFCKFIPGLSDSKKNTCPSLNQRLLAFPWNH